MSRSFLSCAALLAALATAACGGGDNPAGASGAVTLRGTVLGAASAAAPSADASLAQAGASAARITVSVQQAPGLTTTVGGDGTFELQGVPEGALTLVFMVDGRRRGAVDIAGAAAGQEIRVTVQMSSSAVTLVHVENGNGGNGDSDDDDGGDDGASRACAISGGTVGEDIELEGHVAHGDAAGFDLDVNGNRVKNGATVHVTTGGASFKCNGKPSNSECRASVRPSAQVHVRGRLNTCDQAAAVVAASEVKVQKP